jgi:hypothetical protein
MRDQKRIDRILKEIETYWKAYPDMRFNQLLINLGIIPDGKHWFVEDTVIEGLLKNPTNLKKDGSYSSEYRKQSKLGKVD